MYEGVDTIVLFEELAYEDVLPVRWRAANGQPSETFRRSCMDGNLKILQAAAALEEHGQPEKNKQDDHSQYHADIVRLDMKINLLIEMVGQLLAANQPRPEAMSIRFNKLGAVWTHKGTPPPVANAAGLLEVYLKESVAEPLRLLGRIASVGPDGRVKMQFDPVGQAVADLLEKLAFRRHRRQVAGVRQPKNK
ncbi:MAG TPA: PilZ domain-containing protein [Steroidobacteraceae bacterium]|jgi:hypothetical protein|nr:PilZ domain-containing protein [Steroidobacteraceae bacterium]